MIIQVRVIWQILTNAMDPPTFRIPGNPFGSKADRRIRREDRSRNTYQNMEFSKKIIEAENPDAKVLFATSEYHVFRSGVWAGLAGLKAEGVGARTKWWFWPNAFMRECLGLLRSRIRQEAVGLVVMAAFFSLLTVLLI